MRFVLSCVVPLLSSWLISISLVTAHNIRVEPRKRGITSPFHTQLAKIGEILLTFWVVECFYEDLHRDDKMTVSFVTAPGDEGNIDIDFWVCKLCPCGMMLMCYRLRVRLEFNLSERVGCRMETFHLMPPRTDSIDTVSQMYSSLFAFKSNWCRNSRVLGQKKFHSMSMELYTLLPRQTTQTHLTEK